MPEACSLRICIHSNQVAEVILLLITYKSVAALSLDNLLKLF